VQGGITRSLQSTTLAELVEFARRDETRTERPLTITLPELERDPLKA
jgi:hypothetical protein